MTVMQGWKKAEQIVEVVAGRYRDAKQNMFIG